MTMDFVDDPLMIATTCFAEVINRLEYGPVRRRRIQRV